MLLLLVSEKTKTQKSKKNTCAWSMFIHRRTHKHIYLHKQIHTKTDIDINLDVQLEGEGSLLSSLLSACIAFLLVLSPALWSLL